MLLKTHFYYNTFRLLQKREILSNNKYKCKILFDHVYILLILNYKIIKL